MPTTAWTRADVALVDGSRPDPRTWTAVFPDAGVARILPDVDFWDLWPVRSPEGGIAEICGAQVWAGLSAPASGHPGARHDSARIRLVRLDEVGWTDLGPLFHDEGSAGSREWAGSLVFDSHANRLQAFYTAAGERGEPTPTFRQRIMGATATVRCAGSRPVVEEWSPHREELVADGIRYRPANEASGEPGFIKAFRDPFAFTDPDGSDYLVFTGSMASSVTDFNGCIGLARATAEGWTLLDPLITADGVNNELERPHVVVRDGRYYLFFSTQRRTFHPDVTGPTGLYGFVGEELIGPYRPLNGSGLVLRNPPEEPYQAYSWLVQEDLRTTAFVDSFALHGRSPDDLEHDGAHVVRQHFGGTMTPVCRLGVDGDRAWIAEQDIPLRR